MQGCRYYDLGSSAVADWRPHGQPLATQLTRTAKRLPLQYKSEDHLANYSQTMCERLEDFSRGLPSFELDFILASMSRHWLDRVLH